MNGEEAQGNYRSNRLSQINCYNMKYKQKYACKVSGDKRNAFTFKGGDILDFEFQK